MDGDMHYAVIVLVTVVVAVLVVAVLRRAIDLLLKRNLERLRAAQTDLSFLKNSVSFVVFTAAIVVIFMQIPQLKNVGAALFAGAGVLAAIVGFASQKAFANIISGVFIVLFKPFRVDDILELNDAKMGMVEEITLRHTVIRDFENRRIVIPNSIISEQTIINSHLSDERIRKHIGFQVSYDSDLDQAMAIIAEEALRHPNCIDGRSEEDKAASVSPVTVRVISHDDSGISLRLWVWCADHVSAFELSCDLLKSVKERFDAEGIEIPFPHRTIVQKEARA